MKGPILLLLLTVACTRSTAVVTKPPSGQPATPSPPTHGSHGISAPPPLQPPAVPASPRCEGLEERCQADRATTVPVGQRATVHPPTGWYFAQGNDLVLATAPQGGALVAFRMVPGQASGEKLAALRGLLTELGVAGVSPDVPLFEAPEASWAAGPLDVSVWQVEKPKQGRSAQQSDPTLGGYPGALLVSAVELDRGETLLGVGFLLRSAPTSLVGPIREAITSVRPRGGP